jgi:protein subunit release factor B
MSESGNDMKGVWGFLLGLLVGVLLTLGAGGACTMTQARRSQAMALEAERQAEQMRLMAEEERQAAEAARQRAEEALAAERRALEDRAKQPPKPRADKDR